MRMSNPLCGFRIALSRSEALPLSIYPLLPFARRDRSSGRFLLWWRPAEVRLETWTGPGSLGEVGADGVRKSIGNILGDQARADAGGNRIMQVIGEGRCKEGLQPLRHRRCAHTGQDIATAGGRQIR